MHYLWLKLIYEIYLFLLFFVFFYNLIQMRSQRSYSMERIFTFCCHRSCWRSRLQTGLILELLSSSWGEESWSAADRTHSPLTATIWSSRVLVKGMRACTPWRIQTVSTESGSRSEVLHDMKIWEWSLMQQSHGTAELKHTYNRGLDF